MFTKTISQSCCTRQKHLTSDICKYAKKYNSHGKQRLQHSYYSITKRWRFNNPPTSSTRKFSFNIETKKVYFLLRI